MSNAVKPASKICWTFDPVIISDEKVTLNVDSYKKRDKVFNNLNEWVYTKPITINNIENQLMILTESLKEIFIKSSLHPPRENNLNRNEYNDNLLVHNLFVLDYLKSFESAI